MMTAAGPATCEFELHPGIGWCTAERSLVRFVNHNDANGYYKALGLPPEATVDEIKARFRILAMKLHPDRGGDTELFQYLVEIVNVLLDSTKKSVYDGVSNDYVYLGRLEREELVRSGMLNGKDVKEQSSHRVAFSEHWTCLTSVGSRPSQDTDTWINFCREVSRAVGYSGKIRAGVIEGGQSWPCDPSLPWGIISANSQAFVVFKRGVTPNRLHALCAMIDWKKRLLLQASNGPSA